MTIIQPTRTCFDDALELLVEICIHQPAMKEKARVVHALIEGNEPGAEGETIAHGWLEYEGEVFFCGIIDGRKVQLAQDRREFYKHTKPKLLIRYTGREVADLNQRTKHTGPWDNVFIPYTENPHESERPTEQDDSAKHRERKWLMPDVPSMQNSNPIGAANGHERMD